MEILKGSIFPPCGVKIGENDQQCLIICPAMFWEKSPDNLMKIAEINIAMCETILEDSSCPERCSLRHTNDQ